MSALDRELARALVAAVREDADLRAELRTLLLPEQPSQPESPWLAVDEAAAFLRVSHARSNGGSIKDICAPRRSGADAS
jgi:hypothetical protein